MRKPDLECFGIWSIFSYRSFGIFNLPFWYGMAFLDNYIIDIKTWFSEILKVIVEIASFLQDGE